MNAELGGTITQSQQVTGQLEQTSFTGQQEEPASENCTRTAGGHIKITVEQLPYSITATYEGQQTSQDGKEQVGFGKVHAEGQTENPIQFSFRLTSFPFTECKYEAKEEPIQGKIINGTTGASQVIFDGEQAEFKEKEAKLACFDEAKFVATFDVKEKEGEQRDVYIAKEKGLS